MNLLAVACQKETLTDYTEMFKRAGFRLRLALPPLAALQNLVAQSPQTPDNFCIIDLSHRETQLHFFAHRIYDVTRTLDIGGRDITRAIAEHFGVDEHMADEYKLCNFNGAQQLESVVQVFGSIAVDASRALNFFSFNNPQIVIETAYFFGGNSLIPALVQALAAQIDIPLISIASLMPPYASPDTFHIFCPLAYGATIGG